MTTNGLSWRDPEEFYIDCEKMSALHPKNIPDIACSLNPDQIFALLQSLGTHQKTHVTSAACIKTIYERKTSLTTVELEFYLKTQYIDLSLPNFLQSVLNNGLINTASYLQSLRDNRLFNITSLDLSNTNYTDVELENISFLFPNLTTLDLSVCTHIQDFTFLRNFRHLTSLNLSWCTQIQDFTFFDHLPNLSTLNLSWCTQLQDVIFLKNHANLTTLIFSWCTQLQDASSLGSLTGLTHLNLFQCKCIQNFNFLANLESLAFLNLKGCNAFQDNLREHLQDNIDRIYI